jgi:16S rRNA (uracil1498-N3)-methyltransferase
MNLLLLEPEDLLQPDLAAVSTSRYPARAGWWPPPAGGHMRVAMRDGLLGEACVERVDAERIHLRFALDRPPPPPLPLTLLMALPRPKTLRRVLRTAAELGIKQIYLINAARVEKSYWQTPLLRAQASRAALRDGLEQVCDSRMPALHLRPRLRPFVEDELGVIAAHGEKIIAHPAADRPLHAVQSGHITLAIGPEGGFSAFEVQMFERAGFTPASLGPRVLRAETALPVLCSTLFAGTSGNPWNGCP